MKKQKNKVRARLCNPPVCKRITLRRSCDRCRGKQHQLDA